MIFVLNFYFVYWSFYFFVKFIVVVFVVKVLVCYFLFLINLRVFSMRGKKDIKNVVVYFLNMLAYSWLILKL